MYFQSCGRNEEDCRRNEKANNGMMMKTGKKLWHEREELVKKNSSIKKGNLYLFVLTLNNYKSHLLLEDFSAKI